MRTRPAPTQGAATPTEPEKAGTSAASFPPTSGGGGGGSGAGTTYYILGF